ncbi:MAG: hypothetical protein ACTTJW_01015 [Sphaerochaeta sp.]
MERLNLTPTKEKTLPVSINGKNVDLRFDASDRNVTISILTLVDTISDYVANGEKFKEKPKTTNGKNLKAQIADLREYLNQGIDLCGHCSEEFGKIFPEWDSVIGDNYIDIRTYEALLIRLVDVIREDMEKTEKKIAEEIKEER